MNASGTITMSMTELDRLKVVQAVCERRLKPGQAADRLALSVRQLERLVLRYQAAGVAGLVSGKRGRAGNHQLSDGVARRALAIIRERYADFGPTLACEKLRECHSISLSVETVRALMMAAGLWIRGVLCEHESGQGACRARQPDVAGPARQGTEVA
ncbi:hypothetical protein OKW30_006486 [Paraburkholderia sp. Clong3]